LILISIYKKRISLLLIIIAFILPITGCTKATLGNAPDPNKLLVHYIDVGQADSILIQVNNKNLLIDAGNYEDGTKVMTYLQKQGVKKLDYIIATHPHEDHIGGMSFIIKKFDVGQFYAPRTTNNTKNFEGMITALKNKKLKINLAKNGVLLNLGLNTNCEILSPNSNKYDDINNYSATIKLNYGSTSFLFMGDAHKISESEIIKTGANISCDVLKIAHHGSSSSSSIEFLDLASPKFAIISCGKNNDYGHPHKQTLDKLKQKNVILYRTDLNGTIVLQSDGTKIKKL
jgi:competence protein ComEC